jgi:hypothetical protein
MSVINRERNGYHMKKQRGGTQQPTGMIGAAAWATLRKNSVVSCAKSVTTGSCQHTPFMAR